MQSFFLKARETEICCPGRSFKLLSVCLSVPNKSIFYPLFHLSIILCFLFVLHLYFILVSICLPSTYMSSFFSFSFLLLGLFKMACFSACGHRRPICFNNKKNFISLFFFFFDYLLSSLLSFPFRYTKEKYWKIHFSLIDTIFCSNDFWSTATSTSIYFSLIIISGKNRPRQLLQTFLNELLCTILQKNLN